MIELLAYVLALFSIRLAWYAYGLHKALQHYEQVLAMLLVDIRELAAHIEHL